MLNEDTSEVDLEDEDEIADMPATPGRSALKKSKSETVPEHSPETNTENSNQETELQKKVTIVLPPQHTEKTEQSTANRQRVQTSISIPPIKLQSHHTLSGRSLTESLAHPIISPRPADNQVHSPKLLSPRSNTLAQIQSVIPQKTNEEKLNDFAESTGGNALSRWESRLSMMKHPPKYLLLLLFSLFRSWMEVTSMTSSIYPPPSPGKARVAPPVTNPLVLSPHAPLPDSEDNILVCITSLPYALLFTVSPFTHSFTLKNSSTYEAPLPTNYLRKL